MATHHRTDTAQPLLARRPARPPRPEPTFIPVDSHRRVVRTALKSLALPPHIVIIHGPPGSGRTTVARQVARLMPRQSLFLDRPPVRKALAEKRISRLLAERPRRVPPLLVVDGFTLDHAEWPWLLRSYAGGPHPILAVSSTAWWLHHAESLAESAFALGLKLLQPADLAHLANGYHRLKHPQSADLDADYLEACEIASEGLPRKVVEFMSGEQAVL